MADTLVATPSTETSWRREEAVNPRGLEGVAPTGPDKATLILTPTVSKLVWKRVSQQQMVYLNLHITTLSLFHFLPSLS
jgi:hypothetical protein